MLSRLCEASAFRVLIIVELFQGFDPMPRRDFGTSRGFVGVPAAGGSGEGFADAKVVNAGAVALTEGFLIALSGLARREGAVDDGVSFAFADETLQNQDNIEHRALPSAASR